jgi:hypothetical protein
MTQLLPYVATYGIKQKKGGWFITEQMFINASSESNAWIKAKRQAMRGEDVYLVEPIKEDKELLDYDSMDVI